MYAASDPDESALFREATVVSSTRVRGGSAVGEGASRRGVLCAAVRDALSGEGELLAGAVVSERALYGRGAAGAVNGVISMISIDHTCDTCERGAELAGFTSGQPPSTSMTTQRAAVRSAVADAAEPRGRARPDRRPDGASRARASGRRDHADPTPERAFFSRVHVLFPFLFLAIVVWLRALAAAVDPTGSYDLIGGLTIRSNGTHEAKLCTCSCIPPVLHSYVASRAPVTCGPFPHRHGQPPAADAAHSSASYS